MSGKGLLVAATSSKSGKSTVTMALARALKNKGHDIRTAKSGPDYIDPAFHTAATGHACVNLDGWAMSAQRIRHLASTENLLLVEGAMGLFDAASDGQGASAEIAKLLNLPVLLVVDCASQSQSVAALVSGFIRHDPNLTFAGLILNRVGSPRHEKMLRDALHTIDLPILGAIHRSPKLGRPSRHLGLVQAGEDTALDEFLNQAAEIISAALDLDRIVAAATALPQAPPAPQMPPLGTHIAIARDAAFTFLYPHLIQDWTAKGAHLSYFSPLEDQPPHPDADAIYLPGGYPELHAAKLTRAGRFRHAMKDAAKAEKTIYGECGGYMVLGQSITDANGISHPMTGLLDLETSFAERKLHLGYRNLTPVNGPFQSRFKAHEFHYASTLHANGSPLFHATDALGCIDTYMGLVSGSVSGSFAHIIDLG